MSTRSQPTPVSHQFKFASGEHTRHRLLRGGDRRRTTTRRHRRTSRDCGVTEHRGTGFAVSPPAPPDGLRDSVGTSVAQRCVGEHAQGQGDDGTHGQAVGELIVVQQVVIERDEARRGEHHGHEKR